MATTPEIKTKFTLDGLREAATGLRGFAKTVSDTLADARAKGGKVFDPVDRGLARIEDRAKAASKAVLSVGGRTAFAGLRTSALGAGIAVSGLAAKLTAVSTAAIKAAKDSAASLKSLSIDAQRIGGSTSDVAVLGYAADLTGTDRDELVTQIATISNEFLTLRDNIGKAQGTYRDFLSSTAREAALAIQQGDGAGLQSLIGGFSAADLEARKQSLTDIEQRVAQINSDLSHDNSISDVARLQLEQERQQLLQAADAFKAAQSPQAQALFELQKFGLDIDKASQGGVESLLEISDAFRQIQDPSQKARVAMRLFGQDAGVKLIPLLNGGREAIEEYRRTLEKSGAIATEKDIENAEKYSRAIQNLKVATSGVQLTIARALTPDLTKAAEELTDWIIRSREKIASFAVEAFQSTRTFAEDVFAIFSGNTSDIKTGWLDVVVQKALALRDVWTDVVRQISLLWEGEDADYEWLNTLRDAFVEVKAFAMDAWAVVSGGDALKFQWLNAARDQVVAFAERFLAAFQMMQSFVTALGDVFNGVLSYFHTDIATLGLFLGLARIAGLLPVITTSLGLLFKAFGRVFGLGGGAAVGAAGAAAAEAGGAAAGALATAGTLRVALLGVGTAIGGLISAATVLGTVLVTAFELGQKAAEYFFKDRQERLDAGYDEILKAQTDVIKAQSQPYINKLLTGKDDRSRVFQKKYYKDVKGIDIGWSGMTDDERYLAKKQGIDTMFGGEPRYTGKYAIQRYREDDEYRKEEREREAAQEAAKKAAQQQPTRTVEVKLDVAGRQTTLYGDEVNASQFERDLEVATRRY